MAHLYIFGDSITYGASDLKGGWVQRLRFKIDKRNMDETDYSVSLYNLGVSGDTAEDIIERLDRELLARKFSETDNFIIIAVGINDSVYLVNEQRMRFSFDEFRENLETLLELASKHTSQIAFVGLTPVEQTKVDAVPGIPDLAYRNNLVEQFDNVIRKFCQANNVEFIDIWQDWIQQDYAALLFDGLHPNSKGHKLIAEKVEGFLLESGLI